MDKKEVKPKKYEDNPFYPELSEVASFYYVEEDVKPSGVASVGYDEETGELLDSVFIESKEHIYRQTIKTPFIRLMRNGIMKLAGLDTAGFKLFCILSASVSIESHNKDYVYLGFEHSKSMAEKAGITLSKVSYYKGVSSLVDAGIIARSTRTNIFWLNISIIFNGDFTKLDKIRDLDSTRRKLKEEGKMLDYVPVKKRNNSKEYS